MIPARKIAWFNFLLRRWLSWLLRRRFHGIYVMGADHLRQLDGSQPVIGCVNHTNWWDGFVLYVVSHRFLPHDIYLTMEEKNLRKYRFFTWMGVFGIDLTSSRTPLSGVRWALRLLSEKSQGASRLIWIFVQGRLQRAQAMVEVKPGATFLARKTGAQVLPLVMRYEWLSESRPSIFINVGASLLADCAQSDLAATLNAMLARIDHSLEPLDLSEYESMFPPRMSMNKRWDYFRHFLSGKTGQFDRYNL